MKSVEVTIRGYDLIKFGDVMRDLPQPSSINIFKMEPLTGFALVVIESPMVFSFVDQLFGGGNAPWVKTEGRYYTPIEQKIIRKIVDTALTDLGLAWQEVLPVELQYVNSEMNPQFVTILNPVENVIRIEIQIEMANFVGNLFFCIPISLIEPVKEKLFFGIRHQVQASDQRWISSLKETLKESSVVLQVDIGSLELSFRELIHLEKGNVITLQTSIFDELLIRVEGVPKMKGTAGYYRGNQGIKVTKFLENN